MPMPIFYKWFDLKKDVYSRTISQVMEVNLNIIENNLKKF